MAAKDGREGLNQPVGSTVSEDVDLYVSDAVYTPVRKMVQSWQHFERKSHVEELQQPQSSHRNMQPMHIGQIGCP